MNMPEHGGFEDCPICGGSGVVVIGVTVYEPGCGFPHDSTDERRCASCNGTGQEWVSDEMPDTGEER